MNERKKALMRVQTFGFALDEAVLFLDTHPHSAEALEYYHEKLKMYNDAVAYYVKTFGPLEYTQVQKGHGWTWAKDCLPWEDECNVEI